MLIEYINAAMGKAKYELLDNNEGFSGTIRGCKGVLGHAMTLEACREDLRGTLEGWIIVKLRHNANDLPVIGGVNLNVRQKKSKVA